MWNTYRIKKERRNINDKIVDNGIFNIFTCAYAKGKMG